MSKQLWKVKKFAASTIKEVHEKFLFALKKGADPETAARFAAYCVERDHQSSSHPTHMRWDAAVRSNHRYAQGRNRENYLEAARLTLIHVANSKLEPGSYLDPSTPWFIVADILVDKSLTLA